MRFTCIVTLFVIQSRDNTTYNAYHGRLLRHINTAKSHAARKHCVIAFYAKCHNCKYDTEEIVELHATIATFDSTFAGLVSPETVGAKPGQSDKWWAFLFSAI